MTPAEEISALWTELKEARGLGYEAANAFALLLDELGEEPEFRARMRAKLQLLHDGLIAEHNYPAKGSYVAYFQSRLAEPTDPEPTPRPALRLVYSRD